VEALVKRLGLQSNMRPRGRPRTTSSLPHHLSVDPARRPDGLDCARRICTPPSPTALLLVRRRVAAGPVDFQLGQLGQPLFWGCHGASARIGRWCGLIVSNRCRVYRWGQWITSLKYIRRCCGEAFAWCFLADKSADDDLQQLPAETQYVPEPPFDPQLVWKGKDEQDAQPLEVLRLQEALGQRANAAAAVA
jgi:hypothetical protein